MEPITERPVPPISVRVTAAERRELLQRAGDHGLSAYVRNQLLNEPRTRKTGRHPAEGTGDVAQVLALLGASDLASSLRDLAHAAKIGALPVLPETEKAITDACLAVEEMRGALMVALGLKEDRHDPER